MKIKYVGNKYPASLEKDKVYEVTHVLKGWYGIFDESGEEYAFPADQFEIVEK